MFDEYTWVFAIVTLAFTVSSFNNGANDIANSYSTTVAARSLTLLQVGILAGITEFVGAVFFGARVTNTLKSSILDISRFDAKPEVLMVVMMSAEIGSAAWLWIATKRGFSVSTTQTTIGAIIGAGMGAGVMPDFSFARKSKITQTMLTWTCAPTASGIIASLVYGIVTWAFTKEKRSLGFSIKVMPICLAATATVMALFVLLELSNPGSASKGAGIKVACTLGPFFGILGLAYVFWVPLVRQMLVREDRRIRVWHMIQGPYLLCSRNPKLFLPGKETEGDLVPDYNHGVPYEEEASTLNEKPLPDSESTRNASDPEIGKISSSTGEITPTGTEARSDSVTTLVLSPNFSDSAEPFHSRKPTVSMTPEERWLAPYKGLRWFHPTRLRNLALYCLLQGVKRDVVTLKQEAEAKLATEAVDADRVSAPLTRPPSASALAKRQLQNKKEHLLTYGQVVAAMMMSIAHGSNDVSNAVGPWITVYSIWWKMHSTPDAENPPASALVDGTKTPVWILVAAALLMGLGFWIRGWIIMSATGTKLVRQTPSRGFSVAMGTALTVLLASHVGMPVSTTQCIIGACVGVGFFGGGGIRIRRRIVPLPAEADRRTCNPFAVLGRKFRERFEVRRNRQTVNWKQVGKMFAGWVLTLPVAGLISAALTVVLLKSPHLSHL